MSSRFLDRFNLSRISIENPVITIYLLVVLLIAGIGAYTELGQDEDPPFTFRVMVVRAFWPGATTMQMAQQVADPLEKTLQQVPYVDMLRSYSKSGESTIFFQVKDYTPPEEVPNVWYTVRKKIGDMKATLPAGVQGPVFNDEFGDVFGVIYALTGDGFTPAEMRDRADSVRQSLLKVPDVAKVEIIGLQHEEIVVELDSKRLARLGIDMRTVLAALNDQNQVAFAGQLSAPDRNVQVRVSGQFHNLDELRKLPLRFNNRTFMLSDIATIKRQLEEPPAPKARFNGQDMIALAISMSKGGNIIHLGESLKTTISAEKNQ